MVWAAGWGGGEQEGATLTVRWQVAAEAVEDVVKATPAGVLEITDSGTRFIRFVDPADIAKACVGGLTRVADCPASAERGGRSKATLALRPGDSAN